MLQSICDIIILVAAVLVAITNIFKFFGKPIKFIKDKNEKDFKQNLEEHLPALLEKHDLETRDRYLSDRLRYLEEIRDSVAEKIGADIQAIKEMNIEQSKEIKTLSDSSKDMLREKIMGIYHAGKKEHLLTTYQHEALKQYYKDYKAESGNSYIDKYWDRMSTWKVLDDDYE